MRRASCALLLGLVACAPARGDHYRVAIDPAFSAAESAAVRAAVDDWSASVPVALDVVVANGEAGDGQIAIHPGDGGGTWAVTYGAHEVDGGNVFLDVGALRDGVLQGAAAHELGHAMGLEHVTDATEPVLMYPATGPRWVGHVTPNDAEQWYRVRGRVAE